MEATERWPSGSFRDASSPAAMDDLPFSLEDLPPEIRDKIDDIIEKNENLDSQLDAIDALLFADRSAVKFDIGGKYDLGNESGIGSDSDSGNGFLPPGPEKVADPFGSVRLDGVLLKKPGVYQNHDEFVNRLIKPPYNQSGGTNYSVGGNNFLGRYTSQQRSNYYDSEREGTDPSFLLPPPEFGDSSLIPNGNSLYQNTTDAVRTGNKFVVTLDVPRETLPSKFSTLPAGRTGGPSPHSYSGTVPRALSRENLHAPDGYPSEKPLRSSAMSIYVDTPGQNLVSAKKDYEQESAVVNNYKQSTLPSMYVRVSPGSTANLCRKKWRPLSEAVSSGATDGAARSPLEGDERADLRGASDDETSPNRTVSDGEKSAASDDDLSDLVEMRVKSNKRSAARNNKIDPRAMKAQSMMSLYDPTNDDVVKGKSKGKQEKQKPGSTTLQRGTAIRPPKAALGTLDFLRRKFRIAKKQSDSKDRSFGGDSVDANNQETDVQRSDYLSADQQQLTSASSAPAFQSTIPNSASYYKTDGGGRTIGSPPPPGDISAILRVDARDLEPQEACVRPAVTFNTFRGEIQPIRWSEETSKFPLKNRWSMVSCDDTTTPNGGGVCSSSSQSATLASRHSVPSNLLYPGIACNKPLSTNDASYNVAQKFTNRPNFLPCTPLLSTVRPNDSRANSVPLGGQRSPSSSCVLVVNGRPTATPPVVRVMTPSPPTPTTVSQSPKPFAAFNGEGGGDAPHPRGTPQLKTNSLPYRSAESYENRPQAINCRIPTLDAVDGTLKSGHYQNGPNGTLSNRPNDIGTNSLSRSKPVFDSVSSRPTGKSEEERLLETAYEGERACELALDDLRRLIASFKSEKDQLIALFPDYSITDEIIQTTKESLVFQSRQLVTDSRMTVSGATKSRQQLTASLNGAIHTLARLFQAARLFLMEPLSSPRLKAVLAEDVLFVAQLLYETLTTANLAAGRAQTDPAMERLMRNTTDLAKALARLVSTSKSIYS